MGEKNAGSTFFLQVIIFFTHLLTWCLIIRSSSCTETDFFLLFLIAIYFSKLSKPINSMQVFPVISIDFKSDSGTHVLPTSKVIWNLPLPPPRFWVN